MNSADAAVRRAGRDDADAIGRLLHAFNREFDEPTPEPEILAVRMRELLAGDDFAVLLAGADPAGLVVLRFRPAIWSAGMECYLAELYVVPQQRGRGLGRALMHAAIDLARDRGADTIDLGTSDDDHAARSLYESLGFVNREAPPDGPITYFYELEL
ncbi:GNAT family N-acetyltransferase [Conexibacter sp. CPCC 206217]|uniref:GNAT family N-acetyltransferase n=1 Tax=Conexibacter sp. CPCC 206217 TaxID=3064574 RepID=UPI002723B159|nr:GNAT family N-acetyltransferase [Conexibacter sp. CPCC 206217]MDO8213488.1 GNAT family N-acetyltransferase [Conexibacter sp. CPCC 206217]